MLLPSGDTSSLWQSLSELLAPSATMLQALPLPSAGHRRTLALSATNTLPPSGDRAMS